MSGLYDSERISKIGTILPGLTQYIQRGDELCLGLEGDPMYPYRGTERPTGIVRDVETDGDTTYITTDMNDGSTRKLSSRTVGAFDTFEFTPSGFEKVLKREEEKAARSESLSGSSYRNAAGDSSRLESQMEVLRNENDAFKKTIVSTLREIAAEVAQLGTEARLETKFCSSLAQKYDDMMEARAESAFRGTLPGESESDGDSDAGDAVDDEDAVEPTADVSRSEKFAFSESDFSDSDCDL
jgi:hypothetical protein